mgnify:CR=1 FL=1
MFNREWVELPITEVNGTVLHYHVKGKGPALLCIHPPVLSGENFNYQRETLSDEYRVITFDVRGHGHSAASKVPLTYPLIVEDMRRLLGKLGVSECWLLGYSTGGSIALEALLTDPELFRGAVLLSAMSEMSDAYNRARLKLAAGLCALGAKRLVSWSVSYGNADMALTRNNLHRSGMHGDPANIRQYYECALSYNVTARLGEIRQPVLLIYGTKDKSFYKYAHLLHRRLPHAELRWVPDVGHQLPTKAPEAVNRWIRSWLHEQSGKDRAARARRNAKFPISPPHEEHPPQHPQP